MTDRVLLLGCHGGVARALCALLDRSEPGKRVRERLDALFCLDARSSEVPLPIRCGELLPPKEIKSADDLGKLVRDLRINKVIDLSSLDSVDCTRVCDDLGAHYMSTSVEEWPSPAIVPTDEAIARLLPPFRPSLERSSHLIGSGANPGIVNALVFAALEAFAKRVGVAPTVEALGLHSILITEEDTTREPESDPDVFSMTWHPEHCLEELFEARAFAARRGRVVGLGHRPTEFLYEARCGDHLIEGMVVPHEETVTLATRLSGVEIAFVYRIPEASLRALALHPERDRTNAWKRTRRLYPPYATDLTGYDRLGVLLCSRRHGELWMGFHTDVSQGVPYGTNATQLQVAAGVLAGFKKLGRQRGVHFVEDLGWRHFLRIVTEVLGEPIVVHDAAAPSRMLSERVRTDLSASAE